MKRLSPKTRFRIGSAGIIVLFCSIVSVLIYHQLRTAVTERIHRDDAGGHAGAQTAAQAFLGDARAVCVKQFGSRMDGAVWGVCHDLGIEGFGRENCLSNNITLTGRYESGGAAKHYLFLALHHSLWRVRENDETPPAKGWPASG